MDSLANLLNEMYNLGKRNIYMKEQITITKVFRLLNPNLNLTKYSLDDFGKEPIGFVAKYR